MTNSTYFVNDEKCYFFGIVCQPALFVYQSFSTARPCYSCHISAVFTWHSESGFCPQIVLPRWPNCAGPMAGVKQRCLLCGVPSFLALLLLLLIPNSEAMMTLRPPLLKESVARPQVGRWRRVVDSSDSR